jgi:hypothetical protein
LIPNSDVWFANAFFHSVGSLFALLVLPFDTFKIYLNFIKSSLSFFKCPLKCCIQETSAKSNTMKFFPCVFSSIL